MDSRASLTSSESFASGDCNESNTDFGSDDDHREIFEAGHFGFDPLATSNSNDGGGAAKNDGEIGMDFAEVADEALRHTSDANELVG